MKKLAYIIIALAIVLIPLIATTVQAQELLVKDWGRTSRGIGWPILNTAATPDGNSSMGAETYPANNAWATIRGGFQTVEADLQNAIVVTGQLEWVGGDLGASYIPIRYALTFQDSATLQYQYTDSARWVSTKNHQGYEFTPRSGTADMANGTGGRGVIWTVNGAGWNSTYSNGGLPISAVEQAPRFAQVVQGVYDFAISVQPLANGSNEVRWYLVEQNQRYWIGGIGVDTAQVSNKFNGICFGVTGEHLVNTTVKQINVIEATVNLGAPIDIPAAPFETFYVDQWGATNRNTGKGWPILNRADTPVGDGYMGADGPPANNDWATMRGGFWTDVEATLDKAIVVTGQLEWVGGDLGASYIPIRYGLTYQADKGTLQYQNTDSAKWSGTGSHLGYAFTPRSSTADMANGTGGSGVVWTIKNGNWNSTYSNGGLPISAVEQAPRLAQIVQGVYNFAISVQPLANGSNEVRWYMIEQNKKYWIGGIGVDTAQVTNKFNGIVFGVTGEHLKNTTVKQFNVIEAKVDLGKAIDIPAAPFEAFYVDKWGATNRNTGKGWPILNRADTPVGDGYMGADGPPANNDWATMRGGFWTDVEATLDKAIVVTGQLEWVGGDLGASYIPIRYGLTYQTDKGTLQYQNTDSAKWSGTGSHLGYAFTPRSSTADMANGTGGSGVVWTIRNGNWNSTYSNNGLPISAVEQAPRLAQIVQGVYDFAISVQPLANGSNEVRWYMIEQNKKYWIGGIGVDTAQVTNKFNGIVFGVTGEHLKNTTVKQFNVIEAKVDLGKAIDIPAAPFEAFYVDKWGATNRNTGKGWPILNRADTPVGDGYMGADGPPANNDWATMRGGFWTDVEATLDKAIVVTGQLEWVGGDLGASYIPIRYGLTYQADKGTLQYQNTDSAKWSGTGSHLGYAFTPRSSTADMANGTGGSGVVWTIKNGNWNSTYSNGGLPISAVEQAPRLAQIVQGVYNFAISVQPLANGSNEVRWYMIEQNKKYWIGGIGVDTAQVTNKFNGIVFGVTGEHLKNTTVKQFNVIEAKVDLGKAIDIPAAPFEAFYVDKWGATNRNTGKGWPILNRADTPVGDGYMGADGPPANNDWATMRGGFWTDVEATLDKAIVVTGQLEWVGGDLGASYIPIRCGLTYQTDKGTLQYQNTDSAKWSGTGSHLGYAFTPRSSTADMANGTGGSGVVWTIKNGNWNSTYSNNGLPILTVEQAPSFAEIIEGVYDFAISVQPLANGSNEVRWYMIEQNQKYWIGGIGVDTAQVTNKFNGIVFGVTGEHLKNTTVKQFNVIEAKVDLGEPIEVPDAPFTAHYVGQWGFIGGKTDSWKLTPGEFTGNTTVSGSAAADSLVAIRGGFDVFAVPSKTKALAVTGKLKLVGGGFEDANSLRYGIFNSTAAGKLDSTAAGYAWTGSEDKHSGYLFLPPSGANATPTWAGSGSVGSFGGVANGIWYSTDGANDYALGNILQKPATAVGGAGTYDFGIYVIPQEDGSNNVKFMLVKSDGSYAFGGTVVDAHSPIATTKFNCVSFSLNSSTATRLDLEDVYVNLIDPANVPVSVKEMSSEALPVAYALRQNYPNPFNPTTTIEFELPSTSEVNLVVFDISGRVVAELAKGKLQAGYHKISFDGANLASGVYFIRLKAGDFTSVNKAMLLK
jgi:hypothetical protein